MPRVRRPATRDIFGKQNFFLEIQDQGLEMEHRIHPGLFRLEKDLGLLLSPPTTATTSARTMPTHRT